MQEKQIEMFLDCKNSFFKIISYFFKAKKFVMPKLEDRIKDDLNDNTSKKIEIELNGSYTLKELINAFNAANEVEIKARSIRGDIRALKLKKENYARKIENAKKYIEEIESHKKSIFEFWKFSNKDELPALSEAENTQNNDKNLNKNMDKDFLGVKADSLLRQKLSNDEINALYLFYKIPDAFNFINNDEKLKDILEKLKNKTTKRSLDNLINEYTTVKKINSKEHRENERNEISIFKINEETSLDEFKEKIKKHKKALDLALNKIYSLGDMPIYIRKEDENNEYILGDINPENLIDSGNIDTSLVNIEMNNKTNILYYTNIAFYENINKTLPLGMDLASKVLIKSDILKEKKENFDTIYLLEKQDDFNNRIRKVKIYK